MELSYVAFLHVAEVRYCFCYTVVLWFLGDNPLQSEGREAVISKPTLYAVGPVFVSQAEDHYPEGFLNFVTFIQVNTGTMS